MGSLAITLAITPTPPYPEYETSLDVHPTLSVAYLLLLNMLEFED
jgi:hypothetical protein